MAVVRSYRNGLVLGVPGANPNPPPRGVISGWSAGAVRRHTRRLYSVASESLTAEGFALTLTMRDTPASHSDWFAYRVAWIRRVERMPGFVRLHWVVEWQKRGTPHLHVAVYGHGWTRLEAQALIRAWLDVAEECGALWGAQDFEYIDGGLGWLRYLSKHAARGVAHYQRQGMPSGWEKTGRLYGFRGEWPFADPEEARPTQAGYWRLRRLVRSWRVANARAAHAALPPGASEEAARSARRRITSARSALASGSRRHSAVRGMSEWVPEDVALTFLAILAAEGLLVRETAEEARTRVLEALPAPEAVQAARIGSAVDLMLSLGFVEVPDA